jgi:hypothetical protein
MNQKNDRMEKDARNIHLQQQLNQLSEALFAQIERVPYTKVLRDGKLPVESRAGYLRALAIIYGTLETQLAGVKNQEVRAFTDRFKPRLPLLLSEMEASGAERVKDVIPAISQALAIADKILVNSLQSPFRLLGYVFAMESVVDLLGPTKTKFSSLFNNEVPGDEYKSEILSAVGEMFSGFKAVLEALNPFDGADLGNHITRFNPEAGSYPITTNPLEIQGAIQAGMVCWDEFPYYEHRYGDRGRRFTVSDSVWLVSLADFSEKEAVRQVQWLAKYLSNWGMPTYTMEVTMQAMCRELNALVPDKASNYLIFNKSAQAFKEVRNAFISEREFLQCNAIFEKHLQLKKVDDPILRDLSRNLGLLIASAFADEKAGILQARTALLEWVSDPDRFPENWIGAVEQTVREVEKMIP